MGIEIYLSIELILESLLIPNCEKGVFKDYGSGGVWNEFLFHKNRHVSGTLQLLEKVTH